MAVQVTLFAAAFPLVFTAYSCSTLWSCRQRSRGRGPRSHNSRRSSFVSKGQDGKGHRTIMLLDLFWKWYPQFVLDQCSICNYSIHPFIHSLLLFPYGVRWGWSLSQLPLVVAKDGVQMHVLGLWGEVGVPGENMGRPCKICTGTFLLWGDRTNHCTTLPSTIVPSILRILVFTCVFHC